MSGSDWGRHSKRYRSEIWLWVLLDKYRAGLQLLLPQVCEMCFVIYYQEQKKKEWWENVIITIHVLSKTNSTVNLSRKPGLDFCCDLLQHLQGVPRTCNFYKIIRTSILLVPSSLKLYFISNLTRSNSRIILKAFFAQFVFILFNM